MCSCCYLLVLICGYHGVQLLMMLTHRYYDVVVDAVIMWITWCTAFGVNVMWISCCTAAGDTGMS